jgi:hypothetical protein
MPKINCEKRTVTIQINTDVTVSITAGIILNPYQVLHTIYHYATGLSAFNE